MSQDNGKVKATADGSHKDKQGSSAAVETESQLFTSLLSKVLPSLNYVHALHVC